MNMLQYVWFNMPELWDWSLVRVLHYQYEKPWDPANAKADRLRPLDRSLAGLPRRRRRARPRRPARARVMHVLVTGASGIVGRFVVPALAAAGHRVTTLGRRPGDHPLGPRRPGTGAARRRRARPPRPRPRARRLPRRRGRRPRRLPPPEPRRHPARSSTPPARHGSSFSPRAPSTATIAAAPSSGRATRPSPTRSTARSSSAPRRRSETGASRFGRPGSTAAARTSGRASSPITSRAGRSRRASPPRSTATTWRRPSSRCSGRRRPAPSTSPTCSSTATTCSPGCRR